MIIGNIGYGGFLIARTVQSRKRNSFVFAWIDVAINFFIFSTWFYNR